MVHPWGVYGPPRAWRAGTMNGPSDIDPLETSAVLDSRHSDPLTLQRMAVENSPSSILVLDREGIILYANRPFPGMKVGTVLGQSLLQCVPDTWQQGIGDCLAQAVATGRSHGFEVSLDRSAGNNLSVEGRISPIEGDKGVDLVVVNAVDTSDRQTLENQLRVHAERYRLLTETISDVIWTMDLNQKITYISPSIRPLIGYAEDEMQMMELREILAPESFALAREILLEELRLEYQPDLEPSRSRTLDLKLVRKDGSTVWCEAKMSFLRDAMGRPKGVLGVARDISSWRQAQRALDASEERLRRAQRLEAVGQLAGGVAHDFNNLLTVIIGNVGLMLKDLPSDDLRRAPGDEISKAADRAAVLTRQLLAFSRKQMMLPEVLSLNSVVNEMAGMLRGLVGENIEISLDLDPALARVKVDPSQIELALVNLSVNARDAMPDGGRLVIETANCHLDSNQTRGDFNVEGGPYVQLAVTDSGKGIDDADQARIFEPFFTTKEVGKGTGLGLSTVYGIVKQSGGYIWVNSQPHQGCRFEIFLPLAEVDRTTGLESQQLDNQASISETILIVEDEDSVRTLTRRILQQCGYQVLEADRGGVALDVLRDDGHRVDLLLTDVIMPGMSGTRLAREAVQIRPKLKVLYMSGHNEELLNRHTDIELSSNLLQKPFTPAGLTAMVRQALGGSPPSTPGVERTAAS